jgi:uncharacterized membrane protein (DUF4010 family)
MLGARLGLALTALFGGLNSSTAVTVAYARRARTAHAPTALLAAGIAIAAAVMVARLAIVIGTLAPTLLDLLWPTFAVLALVPLAGVLATLLRTRNEAPAEVKFTNPLQLSTALTFGVLLVAVFVAVAALRQWLGDAGAYAVAAIAALVDVDAVTITLAHDTAGGGLAPATAARAIAIAALVNTAVKGGLAAVLGGPPLRRSAGLVLGVALVGGGVTALATLAG